jgi:hypothetical protein
MYSVASSTADLATFFVNIGVFLAAGIGTILLGHVALLAIGWVTRHARKYITGRKF